MNIPKIKSRVVQLGLSQERLARHLKVHPSILTRYFRGDRKPPTEFVERLNRTLDLLERSERAADEARQRVLAGDAA